MNNLPLLKWQNLNDVKAHRAQFGIQTDLDNGVSPKIKSK